MIEWGRREKTERIAEIFFKAAEDYFWADASQYLQPGVKMPDKFNITNSQIGNVGPGGSVSDTVFNQDQRTTLAIDAAQFLRELRSLTEQLKGNAAAVEAATKAEEAVQRNDLSKAVENLVVAGPEVFSIARDADLEVIVSAVGQLLPSTPQDLSMSRIDPWDASLDPELIRREFNEVDNLLRKQMLRDLERMGLCYIRITAQSPEQHISRSIAKFLGPLTQSQNDFPGEIKPVTPEASGTEGSGDTSQDLGLHVDGTQHDETPAFLIFHYIAGAKSGANSVFVDSARVLFDIPERERNRILVKLAKPDAATFSKKNMTHRGPMVYFSPSGRLLLRIRFDNVISVHPDCVEDFEYLKAKFNEPQYRLEFRPEPGELIVFDNWRVLHARDEVYGLNVRRHWRSWIIDLIEKERPKYLHGIRPVPADLVVQIRRSNQGLSVE